MPRERIVIVPLLLLLLLVLPGAYLLGRESAEPATSPLPPEPPAAIRTAAAPPPPLSAVRMREDEPAATALQLLHRALFPNSDEEFEKWRHTLNETAVIATLHDISSAQARFQAVAIADEDGDGVGEFGTFGELSGNVVVRGGDRKLIPPLLSGAFRCVDQAGVVNRYGYHFALHLPRPGGQGIREIGGGGLLPGETAPDLAERYWICYAWPVEYGRAGKRTFVVGVQGDVLATDSSVYSGPAAPPADSAVRQTPGTGGRITGLLEGGEVMLSDNDWEATGLTWRLAR